MPLYHQYYITSLPNACLYQRLLFEIILMQWWWFVGVQRHLQLSDRTARNSWWRTPRALGQPSNHQDMQKTRETFHQSTTWYHIWEMITCNSSDLVVIAESCTHIMDFPTQQGEKAQILAWIRLCYGQSRHKRHLTDTSNEQGYNRSLFDAL